MHYFNYDRVVSYGCPVNVLVGERGVGKSFGAKKFVIDQFVKKHHHFAYIRRYHTEIKKIFQKIDKSDKDFFEYELKQQYKDHKLEAKNRKFYCDDECFGIAMTLTEAQDLKSTNNEDITTILIDEYFIEKNRSRHYLPDEGMILMGLFDSIIRNRSNIKIFILGNATDGMEYSPLFNFFGLSLPYNKDIKLFKDNLILVQYMNNEEFRKERENTLIGRLAKGTKYEQYAIHNKILNKNSDFIEKKKGTSKFSFAIIYKGTTYRHMARL